MKGHLLNLRDLSPQDILDILDLTKRLKEYKGRAGDQLQHKTIALVFQKPSNRTRVSFEVGISQLGGHCIYLGPNEISLGQRESPEDVSKTLSRYLDGIVARTHSHEDVLTLAKHSSVPVINGLSDLYHPCQALTDIYSIREKFDRLDDITVAYVGDGNNVCHSLLLCCAKVGLNIHIATPAGYEPSEDIVIDAKSFAHESGSEVSIGNSPKEAVKGADVIYADVWVSMGQEKESEQRFKDFKNFQVNADLVKKAKDNFIFMHCLPAHREQEVTSDVLDSPHSIVFDQAENRLHTQKAVLISLLDKESK